MASVERDGVVVLPGRLLVDVVRALPGDQVTMELRAAEQDVEITSGNARPSTSARCGPRTSRPLPETSGDSAVKVPAAAFVATVLQVARAGFA